MYYIKQTNQKLFINDNWSDTNWESVPELEIANYREEGSGHKPIVKVKLLYDLKHLYVFFKVIDKYVKCLHTDYQSPVWKDSCVEFFVRPINTKGYFNFEINCGGTMLLYFIENWERTKDGFKNFIKINSETAKMVSIYHSLPTLIKEEIQEPITWYIQICINFLLFEKYLGPMGVLKCSEWYANFYKCGDETSHPHWGSWQSLQGELNFHRPDVFAPIKYL